MHKYFKEHLTGATGESKSVMVVSVDVRGFSKFSKKNESASSAKYLKALFIKLVNDYFHDADFLKSTGDGLMLVYNQDDEQLHQQAEKIFTTCKKLSADFANLFNGDAIIYFPVPDKCGIGITRGPATCLQNGDVILDYSGDALNTAARLTDCARPLGIVMDYNFKTALQKDVFEKDVYAKDDVYLRGVAEAEKMEIWFSEGVEINERLHLPVANAWDTVMKIKKYGAIKSFGSGSFKLNYMPADIDKISVVVKFSKMVDSKYVGRINYVSNGVFEQRGDEYLVQINYLDIDNYIKDTSILSDEDEIKIIIKYPIL